MVWSKSVSKWDCCGTVSWPKSYKDGTAVGVFGDCCGIAILVGLVGAWLSQNLYQDGTVMPKLRPPCPQQSVAY